MNRIGGYLPGRRGNADLDKTRPAIGEKEIEIKKEETDQQNPGPEHALGIESGRENGDLAQFREPQVVKIHLYRKRQSTEQNKKSDKYYS